MLSALSELVQDMNASLDDVSTLLKRDIALATRVVRISNSPVFGGRGATSVEEAVNRVGFGEITRLVGIVTTGRLAEHALGLYGISAEQLGAGMLYQALACEALAVRAGDDPRPAYTAGLLRPLGAIVLDRSARGATPPTQPFDIAKWTGFSAWEGQVFSINNGEVAAMILSEWKFAPVLSQAIREHYLLRPTDLENPLACQLNLAGWIAREAGHGYAGEAVYWEPNAEKFTAANVSEEQVSVIQKEVAQQYEQLAAVLA